MTDLTTAQRHQLANLRERAEESYNEAKKSGLHPDILRELMPAFMVAEAEARKKRLPITPGSVVQAESLMMCTSFNNWVSEGGFVLTHEEVMDEDFVVIFNAGKIH